MALRTADMVRGSIGRAFRQSPLAFSIEYEEETDTHYMITVRFQPDGEFEGAAGLEEFPSVKMGSSNPEESSAVPYRIRLACP